MFDQKEYFPRAFSFLFIFFAVASLIHFMHNAEFLKAYPGLPSSWSRGGVYVAWVGMTCIGVLGMFIFRKGYQVPGLLIVALYALCGLDSLAHYVVAPFSAHTAAMNGTILLEVTAAGLLFIMTIWLLVLQCGKRFRGIVKELRH